VILVIVGMFVVGMALGWSLGRRDLVKELESLSQGVEV
jgi:hypothetical protein